LQFGVFIVIEIKSAQALENTGLDERERGDRLRLWRSHVNLSLSRKKDWQIFPL
jgi:hypothetical protein